MLSPPMKAAAQSTPTLALRLKLMRGKAATGRHRQPNLSRCRGFRRYMAALMTKRPAACALSTTPQAAGPIAGMAVAGPRTVQIPAWMQLATVTDTEPTQIHRTRRNAAHPARMSLSRLAGAACGTAACGAASFPSLVAQMAATRKVAASKAMAQTPPRQRPQPLPAIVR